MTTPSHGSERQSACFPSGLAKLLVPILLTLSSPSAAAPEIAGRYCGKAWSGGELVEVETTLETSADGLLSGSYVFADNGEDTPGTLREYWKQSDDTRTLIWADRYGTGQLIISFDDNRSSFDGNWGVYVDTPIFHWDGRRCETPVA